MELLGALSYAAGGLLYLLLTALLGFNWQGNRLAALLIGVCLLSGLWALLIAVDSVYRAAPDVVLFGFEVLRAGAWIAFLCALLARLGAPRAVTVVTNLVWVGLLVIGVGLWGVRQFVAWNLNLGALMIPGGLVLALLGLLLIEQLVRNWPVDARWRIKPLALGVGGIFTYDLFLYAQSELFGFVDNTIWSARGAVNILFIPLIAVAARRNPLWDLDIFVSRHVVFYSTTLIAVGLYLIVMSAGGYLILLYGGSWGVFAQIVFLVGAILVLAALFFSTKLRARFKVFLNKHFFRNKYDYRAEWLRLIQTLADFENTSTRRTVILALAQIVGSPAGLLWVFDEKEGVYRFVAEYNHPGTAADIEGDDRMIAFIRDLGWLVDLEEYRAGPERYGDLELPGWLADNDRAWLLVPLFLRRELIGLVLLEKAPALFVLNYEDRDLLKTVGHHLAVQLAQERSDSLLAEAQQFQAYNRLTAFLMHDLNNLIAQQSLIVRNAEKHKSNPDFIDDAMQTIANSVSRMNRIMDQLRTGKSESSQKKTLIKFLVSTAVDRCSGRHPVPRLSGGQCEAALTIDVERFVMVLSHLIQNAQDSTPEDGSVEVSIASDDKRVSVAVRDTGCGMSAEFVRDRLFRPFDSTKGSQGMGIGAYQAREFARQMGGDLRVESTPGKGTIMTMSLPLQG